MFHLREELKQVLAHSLNNTKQEYKKEFHTLEKSDLVDELFKELGIQELKQQ